MYADDLVLFGESREDLRAMVRRSVAVCRRRGREREGEGLNEMAKRVELFDVLKRGM